MYHLVYLTTNLINGKIYVGVHSTFNLNDGYLGSGKLIKRAIKKYGKENFKRVILYYCLTDQEMLYYEELIVNDSFIKDHNTYNIANGVRDINQEIHMIIFMGQRLQNKSVYLQGRDIMKEICI